MSSLKSVSKTQWAWISYDWANSAFATTVMAGFFPIFFKQYYSAGADVTVSTAQLGMANSIGTFFVALTGPLFGAIADKGSVKKKLLALFCFLGVLSTACLALVGEGKWELASLLYVIGSLGFSASVSFYDSLLPMVANSREIDFISALGYAFGYLGGGLLFALNVAMFQFPQVFGLDSGATAIRVSFAMVGGWWLLFTVPLVLWVHEPPSLRSEPLLTVAKLGIQEFLSTTAHLRQLKNLLLFLGAFFLYNDAVGTTIKMAVDYGMSIGFKPGDLIVALLMVQFIGFPAAWAFGRVSSRFHPKKSIFVCIAAYLIVVGWASQMTNVKEFFILAGLIGLVQGGVQALSRSYYARLIPQERAGEFYGFYNLLGRFAGLIGPLLMGATGYLTGKPRLGILSVGLLFVLGAALLAPVNEEQAQAELRHLPP